MRLDFENVPSVEIGHRFKRDVRLALQQVFNVKMSRETVPQKLAELGEALKDKLQFTYEAPQLSFYPDDGSHGEGELHVSIAAADDVQMWADAPMLGKMRLTVIDGFLEKFGL